MKNHFRKNLLLAVALVIPALTHAATPTLSPAAPSINDVADYGSCTAYAQKMQNWLSQFSSSTDHHNSYWFSEFGSTDNPDSFNQSCTNNVCTSYYDTTQTGYGGAAGCFIASKASAAAKNSLLSYLSSAYSAAIQHNNISVNQFGLFGNSTTCSAGNNYAGCNLYYK